MSQSTLLDKKLTREAKHEAEKWMSRYKNISAIIESKKMDLPTKMTVNYQASESQRGNGFHSESERVSLLKIEIEEYQSLKRKLDFVFESLKPVQQKIWEQRYLVGRKDIDIYNDLDMNDKRYYALKKEMVKVVAEALNLA